MIVELRAVPGCPNLDATREVLQTCLAKAGLSVAVVERIGEYPSPSILVDGRDVTGADPEGPAACVLRPPTAEQIRAALRAAVDGDDEADRVELQAQPAAEDCCQPGGAIRIDRPDRAAALTERLRAVHRQVLWHFAATGAAPTLDDLADVAAMADVHPLTALRRLAEDDLVAVEDTGRLIAAYPFSPTPTAHVVEMGGVRVYAMCAIDALGMPAMLHRDATITSTDPQTSEPVTVRFVGGAATFDPTTTVVVYAANSNGRRSVDTCCSTINFFTNPASAQAWLSEHPGLTAKVLDQDAAVALGRDIFGPLLRRADSHQGRR